MLLINPTKKFGQLNKTHLKLHKTIFFNTNFFLPVKKYLKKLNCFLLFKLWFFTEMQHIYRKGWIYTKERNTDLKKHVTKLLYLLGLFVNSSVFSSLTHIFFHPYFVCVTLFTRVACFQAFYNWDQRWEGSIAFFGVETRCTCLHSQGYIGVEVW